MRVDHSLRMTSKVCQKIAMWSNIFDFREREVITTFLWHIEVDSWLAVRDEVPANKAIPSIYVWRYVRTFALGKGVALCTTTHCVMVNFRAWTRRNILCDILFDWVYLSATPDWVSSLLYSGDEGASSLHSKVKHKFEIFKGSDELPWSLSPALTSRLKLEPRSVDAPTSTDFVAVCGMQRRTLRVLLIFASAFQCISSSRKNFDKNVNTERKQCAFGKDENYIADLW